MKTNLMAAASLAALCSVYALTSANATHFEGVYIGLHGGVGIADADYVHFQPLIPQTEPLSFSDSAAVGGAQLGVRFDIAPDWVLYQVALCVTLGGFSTGLNFDSMG